MTAAARAATELHVVDVDDAGITRRRCGRGFRYVHPSGRPVRAARTLARIERLAIPPAWTDVWICRDPRGHIQAVGTDDRGRRQYRYHDDWRVERDRDKHERAVELARALPRLRRRVAADLAGDGLGRDRVLAAALRLLERGLFRVGGERYTTENASFGLATLRKEHVRVDGAELVFDYPAKSGRRRRITIDDPDLVPVVAALKRRRRGGEELLAYKGARGRWTDVRSEEVNAYLQDAVGDGFSSKDLRTWLGTVLAAVALAAEDRPGGDAPSGAVRRRRVARAVKRVARQLGNTPAVARRSYVDPRVIDRYEDGATLDLDRLPDRRVAAGAAAVDDAVVDADPEDGGGGGTGAVAGLERIEGAVVDLIEEA